jgi:glycosyltransferase involved in cell wall biosynthesis
MRVLMVHNRYSSAAPSGEDVVVDAERRLLQRAGHEVITYERHVDELAAAGPLALARTALELQGSGRTLRELSALISAHRPEVAHFHNLFPSISASAYAACAHGGVPVVQTIHNYRWSCVAATHFRDGVLCEACEPGRPWPAVHHGCFRRSRAASVAAALAQWREHRRRTLERGVSRFLALTEFARQRLARAGMPLARIGVRPNFVELPSALPPTSIVEPPYAVYVGRLSDEKGILTLLEAWRDIRGLPLQVIGDGRLRPQCERFVVQHGIDARFLGNLPRPRALQAVAGASMQLIPSRWFEGMPLVMLEAWALGVPVIASVIGGLAEMIGADERALGVAPGDAAGLRQAVERLRASAELGSRLREAGRARYAAAHTPQRGLESLLAEYARAGREAGPRIV